MAVVNINRNQFEEMVHSGNAVLVEFSAPWCVYCRRLAPALESVAEEYKDTLVFTAMNEVHEQFKGSCKFLITYNNDPYIRELADHYGFDTFVQERLHNMRQVTKPGDMFEELLIGNYDLVKQAEINNHFLLEQSRQMTLFDYQYDY